MLGMVRSEAPLRQEANVIQREFHDYQRSRPDGIPVARCSPNLRVVADELFMRWGMLSIGCYGYRNVRGGAQISTHAYGAAIDLSYRGAIESGDPVEPIGFLVAWSFELGIQAVHDYQGCRIWRAGRTTNPDEACTVWWKAQRPDSHGMGQPWGDWLHLEVHPSRWNDSSSVLQRGVL
jgi:hypothetical protein